ncbi:MAG: metal-sulfur cluster assembly factor [Anaerolineae bacterium]|nr:metal-sulfur cluster assembly factor [Anaerolineae bacterium]MDW8099413.1 metal-sulfur cluster assembly factor [Anaerolineae bacterium]
MAEGRMPTVEEIRAVLKANVRDPEIMINVIDLGLVYDIRVDEAEKAAIIDMTLTSPGCPAGPQLIHDVRYYLHQAFPELDEIRVNVVWTPMWTPDMMSQEAKEELGFY